MCEQLRSCNTLVRARAQGCDDVPSQRSGAVVRSPGGGVQACARAAGQASVARSSQLAAADWGSSIKVRASCEGIPPAGAGALGSRRPERAAGGRNLHLLTLCACNVPHLLDQVDRLPCKARYVGGQLRILRLGVVAVRRRRFQRSIRVVQRVLRVLRRALSDRTAAAHALRLDRRHGRGPRPLRSHTEHDRPLKRVLKGHLPT